MSFECGETALQSGDRLVLFTDGLVECRDSGNQQFGRQRLLDAIRHSERLDPRNQIEAVLDEARAFSGERLSQDDVTMLVLQRYEATRKQTRDS